MLLGTDSLLSNYLTDLIYKTLITQRAYWRLLVKETAFGSTFHGIKGIDFVVFCLVSILL